MWEQSRCNCEPLACPLGSYTVSFQIIVYVSTIYRLRPLVIVPFSTRFVIGATDSRIAMNP